jgi:hypothetical protein
MLMIGATSVAKDGTPEADCWLLLRHYYSFPHAVSHKP